MSTIAIIPARSGSKRLPNKNLLDLGGHPLVHWTIRAALESKQFSDVVVTSDGDEILSIAKNMGAIAHRRGVSLSGDTASTADVILDVTSSGYPSSDFCLLQPTSPLRNADHIIDAFELYRRSRSKCLVSVCVMDHPIEWSGFVDKDNRLTGLQLSKGYRSQDLPQRFRLNGAIYIRDTEDFRANPLLVDDQPLAFKMDREYSVDIDEYVDFKLAAELLKTGTAKDH